MKRFTKESARTVLNGAGDEVYPFARQRLDRYVDGREVAAPALAVLDFTSEVEDAYADWMTIPDGRPTEKRAAVLRLAAATHALLTVDEINRGEKTIEQEVARLDPDGNLR